MLSVMRPKQKIGSRFITKINFGMRTYCGEKNTTVGILLENGGSLKWLLAMLVF